jgi:hypothetical protein
VTSELFEHVFAAGAAGRLRIVNRSMAPAAFDVVVGDVLEGHRRPAVQLAPAAGTLDPGGSCVVRVEASLAGFAAGERVTLPLECRWPTGADRLWLVVTALPGPGDAR